MEKHFFLLFAFYLLTLVVGTTSCFEEPLQSLSLSGDRHLATATRSEWETVARYGERFQVDSGVHYP